MNDESEMLQQIERQEAWLREVMPPVTAPSMEPLKLRLRVAVHEAWLARAAAHEARSVRGANEPGPDFAPLKAAVRGEIARKGRRRLVRLWLNVGAGLAAAAAVVLVTLSLLRSPAPSIEPRELAVSQRVADFADALADAVPVSAETKSEWNLLETEILSLEDALADSSTSDWNALEIDDLGGDLEALAEELGQGS